MGFTKKKKSQADVEEDDMEDTTDEEQHAPEPESEQSDSDADEEVKLSEPSKKSIYNTNGLLEKLEDICWPKDVDWIHKLTIDIKQEAEVDVNDDLARELAFYTQGLEGTRKGFAKIEAMGIPFLRPVDYYAEMVKTDTHMEKVKGRLLEEKKKIEEAEERRKARESKKISKEVQAQKLKERAKAKKDDFESVKKWRKQRQQSGFADMDGKDEDMGFNFDEGKGFERSQKKRPWVAPGDRSGGKGRQGGGGGKGKKGGAGKGRERRDSKFGFGGRKGLKKQNTADTTNDFRGFNKGDQPGNKKRKSSRMGSSSEPRAGVTDVAYYTAEVYNCYSGRLYQLIQDFWKRNEIIPLKSWNYGPCRPRNKASNPLGFGVISKGGEDRSRRLLLPVLVKLTYCHLPQNNDSNSPPDPSRIWE